MKKIQQLKKDHTTFSRLKEVAEAGKFEELPGWTWEDWEKNESRHLDITRTFGEFPQEGTLYLKIDGSYEEPL